MAGAAACLAMAATAAAQVTTDALLDKLVEKGILKQEEAQQLKSEAATNTTVDGLKFKVHGAIKSMELYGDIRMRYEYRSAQLDPAVGGYDTADRWRYAVRFGVRGDLADDFYYGLRLETSQNERSTWNTLGSVGTSPYSGPFSKSSYSLYVGLAYLGWRPTSWLDVSIGRVPQPLYTTPMVWDSDYTPEGAVEKVKYTYGPVDFFATFGQYVYQDNTPTTDYGVQGGANSALYLGQFSDQNAYLVAIQVGATYHVDTNLSVKVAPVFYTYLGHGNGNASAVQGGNPSLNTSTGGFYGPFVGQGYNGSGFTFEPGNNIPSGAVPGEGSAAAISYNQTGINNLSILEFPMEVDFKIGRLGARVFGDFSINLEGDDRARAAYHAVGGAAPLAFPGGLQLNQDQALQFGLAVGNNMDLTYGSAPKKGTWEARAYWQHVEQYALDPNLLDSDFFEGRGNLQGLYAAFAYSLSDAMIGTVRYGVAERINNQLGTGGYNGDLPLPNPVNRYQVLQMDVTWKF
jgi:hypothetical protein